jgi:hypothetical protein
MTETPGWWKRRSIPAKAITILASLCILEFGLCAGLPNDANAMGLLTVLFFATAAALFVAFLLWIFMPTPPKDYHDR